MHVRVASKVILQTRKRIDSVTKVLPNTVFTNLRNRSARLLQLLTIPLSEVDVGSRRSLRSRDSVFVNFGLLLVLPMSSSSLMSTASSMSLILMSLLVMISVMILLLRLLLMMSDMSCILRRLNILVHDLMMSLDLTQLMMLPQLPRRHNLVRREQHELDIRPIHGLRIGWKKQSKESRNTLEHYSPFSRLQLHLSFCSSSLSPPPSPASLSLLSREKD